MDKFTVLAASLPVKEQDVIFHVSAQIGVPALMLAAIRLAENGGPGREFGVLSEAADTYTAQARSCALSIRNNQYRYVLKTAQWPIDSATGQLSRGFVEFMALRWAPPGVGNDPTNLNANWPGNVWRFYSESGVA